MRASEGSWMVGAGLVSKSFSRSYCVCVFVCV